jgi:hypothetical protein
MAIKINGTTVIDDSRAITGASISVSGTITGAGIDTGSSAISTTGNVTGGNFLSSGIVSATGNVTGNYIIGNGSEQSPLVHGQLQILLCYMAVLVHLTQALLEQIWD